MKYFPSPGLRKNREIRALQALSGRENGNDFQKKGRKRNVYKKIGILIKNFPEGKGLPFGCAGLPAMAGGEGGTAGTGAAEPAENRESCPMPSPVPLSARDCGEVSRRRKRSAKVPIPAKIPSKNPGLSLGMLRTYFLQHILLPQEDRYQESRQDTDADDAEEAELAFREGNRHIDAP